jgi:hypothetical protein
MSNQGFSHSSCMPKCNSWPQKVHNLGLVSFYCSGRDTHFEISYEKLQNLTVNWLLSRDLHKWCSKSMVPALMQRTEPMEHVGIRWLCRSRLIRATGRHHARHAGRFCFWSSATRVRLRSPIGPKSLHTQPCGLRLEGLRTVWIAQNGDLPGADFPSVKREQRDVIQAQLLCCRRTGGA